MKKFLINPHQPSCFWYEAAEKYGAPNLKWCEATVCSFFSEPLNSFSNIAYFIGAIIIYNWSKNLNPKHKFTSIAMFLMGALSFAFHMSNNYFSQILDFLGMFIFAYWLVTLSFLRANIISKKSTYRFYILLVLLNISASHFMFINHLPFQLLIVLSIILIILGEFLAYKRNPAQSYYWLKICLLIICFAEIFSILDITRIMCDPHNHFFQGHSAWHILSAVGLTIGYKHWLQYEDI